jgi:phosphatidylglycerophosphatase A
VAGDPSRPPGALLLSFFGVGRAPRAPGTAGSLATWLLVVGAGALFGLGPAAAGALFAFGTIVTLVHGDVRSARGHGDPSWVVSDEVAGQALAIAGALPSGHPVALVVSFLLFRLLDVTKPGPIRRLERLPGGGGVLADDLAAGLAAGLLVLGLGALL